MYGRRFFDLLNDRRFHRLLMQLDERIAQQAQKQGCKNPGCHGVLHWDNYQRTPRGAAIGPEFCLRYSLCCSTDGCRKRVTPESVRFPGRKVYLGAVVVVIAALCCGATPARMERLKELVGVSSQTVRRWLEWWREILPQTRCWRVVRGRLASPVVLGELPQSLLDRFRGSDMRRVLLLLRTIGPLTAGQRSVEAAM